MSGAAVETAASNSRKKLVRRIAPDCSQRVRHWAQGLFVALNLWIGAQFFLWVRWMEQGGTGSGISRPPGVDGWLPIAGLMNTRYLLATGRVPAILPAAMYLFLGFVGISLLMKKAFCAWLCPVGTLSEQLWRLGRKLFGKNLRLPRWLDVALRAVKYILLAFFAWFIFAMTADMLDSFLATPFGIVADVRMLNFFRDVSLTAGSVLALLVLGSMVVENFWCRYACPYGALLGLVSLASPVKVRRDSEACIDCGKCARVCPSQLPVDRLVQVRSAECTACLECVAVCPAQDALSFALPPRKAPTAAERWRGRKLSPLVVAGVLAYVFLGVVLLARATDNWQTHVTHAVYQQMVSHAREASHPAI